MNHTRPITLIDHTQKVFTKILTNRLTNILDRNNILSSQNYTAFPLQSTIQPISQLTTIIEYASTTQKEIWLLLQDMSKVFDSIHIPTLAKAMECIKLLSSFINILNFLLSNRFNCVITSYSTTSRYKVQDGIDQGETISPLLWKIYYDPLISRIHKEHTGYLSTIPLQLNHASVHTSIMAYMDDSLWVASTRSELLQIVEKVESFYKFTGIRVNPTKSVLATNSILIDKTIKLNNETITAVKKDELFKYLGA